MENSPNNQVSNSSLLGKIKDGRIAMSPITNLAQGFSYLTATNSKTPCQDDSPSDFISTAKLKNQISSDSPFSNDSPSFQEGILKSIQTVTNFKSGRFHRFFKKSSKTSTVEDDKENMQESDNTTEFIKPKQSLYFNNNGEEDSADEFPKTSQESGFADSRSFTSRSNSIPSVHSSVFTDEELDDDDSLFAIDKLVEDDAPSERLSSTMTLLINSPLIHSDDRFAFRKPPEADQIEVNKPLRRCLSMDIQFKERGFSHDEKCKTSSIIKEECDETSENEMKSTSKFTFKRPEPVDHRITPFYCKRRKSSPVVTIPKNSRLINKSRSPLVRCYSETAATIMRAVQKSFQDPDLIGDCSKPFALPLMEGRHRDLKSITGETLIKLIKGEYNDDINNFIIVDCRYPYEYSGGHIVGAKNIYTKDEIYSNFLLDVELPSNSDQRNLIVFHCEFSSERAPKLLRFLRNKDRELNENSYPRLHHPEVYILEGGYKAFFQQYKEFCEPQDYKPMLHEDHAEELKEFQKEGKCKTYLRDMIQNKGPKSLKFDNI